MSKFGPQPKPISERFWRLVNKNGPIPLHAPHLGRCWLWTGVKARAGRGYFRINNPRRSVPAPRIAWMLATGNWPIHDACHHCDNPSCVRFSHLFDGTKKDNMQDAKRKGRIRNASDRYFGDHHGMAVLRSTDIPVIISRRQYGDLLKDIAADFGLTYQAISSVIRGRTWKHLNIASVGASAEKQGESNVNNGASQTA